MSTTTTKSKNTPDPEAIADFGNQAIDASKKVTAQYIDSCEQTMLKIAELQDKAAADSQIDWVASLISAQANITRELTAASVTAVREIIK